MPAWTRSTRASRRNVVGGAGSVPRNRRRVGCLSRYDHLVRLRILGFLAPLAAALAISPAAWGAVAVTSPTLLPSYSETTTDFTVRCSEPVALEVDSGSNAKVSVDGARPRAGRFTASVTLEPGQAARLKIVRDRIVREQTIRCLPDDFPLWETALKRSPQAQWYVFAPNFRLAQGSQLPIFGAPYVAIVNSRGVPLWWFRESSGQPVDAKLLTAGRIAWGGFGDGEPYRIIDLSGRRRGQVEALTSRTNFHDMQRTDDGGYLLIGDRTRECPSRPEECVDLTRWGGPRRATVIDNVVERHDRRGRLVWSWSTADHLAPEETAAWIGHPGARPRVDGDGREYYDLFHVNSVEEFKGGAVVSVRHADAVYRLSRGGRRVVWKLGGTKRPESLRMPSGFRDEKALSGNHDARVLADGSVTVYDNGSFTARPPRALRFSVVRGKAELLEEIRYRPATFSFAAGSARRMAGGNWAVSWSGGNSEFVELDRRGRPALSLRFPSGLFSYRVDAVEPGGLKAADLRAGMDAQHPR